MAPIASLDNALQNLMAKCSFTAKNSIPSQGFGPELKVMFKIPWVLAKTPGLAKYGISNYETLVRYFDSNRGTYLHFGDCVTTREIYKKTPNDLKVVLDLTKTLYIQPSATTVESLQEIINNDEKLKARLRNVTSTLEFLRLYSDFFLFEDNGSIWPLIQCHVGRGIAEQNGRRVDSLMAIELIRTYIRQMAPAIKLPQLHANLCSMGVGFGFAELQAFVFRFYHPSHVPKYVNPRPNPTRFLNTKPKVIKVIRETLKLWPVNLNKILKELDLEGIPLDHSALKSIIEEHFPDYILQRGFVKQDHQPYMTPVLSVLTEQCPISVNELRKIMMAQGVEIKQNILIEVIAKSLDGYLVYNRQIYLPTCQTTSGELITDVVLNKLHPILDGKCPILLDELISPLGARRIFLTRKKLKAIITKHSTSYKCARNFVWQVDPTDVGAKTSDPEYEDVQAIERKNDDNRSIGESMIESIPLLTNDSNSITNSETTLPLIKAVYDNSEDVNEACGLFMNVHVSEGDLEIVKMSQPDSRPDNLDVEIDVPSSKICTLMMNPAKEDTKCSLSFSGAPHCPDLQLSEALSLPSIPEENLDDLIPRPHPNERKVYPVKFKGNFPEWGRFLEEVSEITDEGVNRADSCSSSTLLPRQNMEASNSLGRQVQPVVDMDPPQRFSRDGKKFTRKREDCKLS
ncbi:uncharacterized protein LOC131892873 isoform X2 [Tigriopus californicus]|nr:uncharacterized protein LOC131892873 isoform X2 [Tigriopus californicus]XP_059098720.1 uncharacterized protein LOC131892873 isoform X2 [Tigriopus californicus]XP_059098721.1 uncharacterized protein LOC131892873 isoform X2 [Tigriopus californicus]